MTREEVLEYQARARAFAKRQMGDDVEVDDISNVDHEDDVVVETETGVWVKAWVYVAKDGI